MSSSWVFFAKILAPRPLLRGATGSHSALGSVQASGLRMPARVFLGVLGVAAKLMACILAERAGTVAKRSSLSLPGWVRPVPRAAPESAELLPFQAPMSRSQAIAQ